MDSATALDQPTTQGRKTMSIQLSDAIDSGLATLGCNERPEGWREADFGDLLAYVAPDCPEITGEIVADFSKLGLVADEGRTWDFRPWGQSLTVRRHRLEGAFMRMNAWKIASGIMSRKAARKAAKRYATLMVAESETAGAKCAVRMGSRTWIAVL